MSQLFTSTSTSDLESLEPIGVFEENFEDSIIWGPFPEDDLPDAKEIVRVLTSTSASNNTIGDEPALVPENIDSDVANILVTRGHIAVSYTHLDVYKRQ